MFHYAFVESLQDIAKWLIIGLLIAALISVLLPPDFFQTYINNDLLGMLIILLAAVPLYVCATGSIPIAAVLLMKGISPGAALVFLMAGPATNAATITVVGKVMGRKPLTGYLISIIGSALLFGLLIDNLLPREWFTAFVTNHHHQHGEHGLPYWLELSSTLILALLLVNIYSKKIRNKFNTGVTGSENIIPVTDDKVLEGYQTFRVSGLDCNQCKTGIENSIGLVSGVEWVEADIATSRVKVKTNGVNHSLIKKAIESSGHRYIGLLEKENISNMENVKIFVKGMTCNHCKANVENIIKSIKGISSVDVNLERSVVLIEGEDLNLNEIKEKIEGIGYEYGGLLN
jgi:copper ion binding protein